MSNLTAAIIQARMDSFRLPGKAMIQLYDKPCIQHVVERVKRSKFVDKVIIATTNNAKDQVLADFCANDLGVDVFRGNEYPVIETVISAANHFDVETIVDITADCPLVDPAHIDKLITMFTPTMTPYSSNAIKRSWPDGFDVQVYRTKKLMQVLELIDNPLHKNHTGWNIAQYCNRDLQFDLLAPEAEHFPDWNLSLDEWDDHTLLNIIFHYFKHNEFSASDVIEYLKTIPELLEINNSKIRKTPGTG